MKFIFIFLSLACCYSVSALEFKCISQMPTTSFLLRTENDQVILKTIHHNGTPYMPIHEGLIVPQDLTYLKQVADRLTKMGDTNEFRFPLKKCKVYGAERLNCSGGDSQDFNGTKMSALSFNTSNFSETVYDQTFHGIKITLSLLIENFVPVQNIVMNYQPDECQFALSSAKMPQ